MSTPDHQLTVSVRFLRRSCAFACAALLLLSSSTNAGTVLQYAQTDPADIVTATDTGSGTTTLSTAGNANGGGVSIPVTISNFMGTPGLAIPAFETFVGVTSIGAATTDIFGNIQQQFSGTVEITSSPGGAGFKYLTAVFGPMTLSPVFGGAGAGAYLSGAQPPDSLVLTSDAGPLLSTTGMGISFSGISPSLSIDSTSDPGHPTIASFTGQDTATFSSGSVPEPGTLGLASFAVALGLLTYWRNRRRLAIG